MEEYRPVKKVELKKQNLNKHYCRNKFCTSFSWFLLDGSWFLSLKLQGNLTKNCNCLKLIYCPYLPLCNNYNTGINNNIPYGERVVNEILRCIYCGKLFCNLTTNIRFWPITKQHVVSLASLFPHFCCCFCCFSFFAFSFCVLLFKHFLVLLWGSGTRESFWLSFSFTF